MKNEIVKAIEDGVEYITNVLLDDLRKSQGDYSILEGKWYDYEPAWHTGQNIFALTRAWEITKKEEYLHAARKAG